MDTKKITKILIIRLIIVIVFGTLFWFITKPSSPTNTEQLTINTEIDQIASGDLQIPEEITNISGELNSEVGDLTILIPGRFYNDGFTQLASKLKTDYNIQINYKKIDNISYYKSIISTDKQPSGIDLFLIPSDWLQGYAGQTIAFDEDITPYFNTIFNNYINQTNTTFLPYAIDPLVTIITNNTDLNYDNQLTLKDISAYVVSHGVSNKVKMPILRGLDKNDLKLLQNGGESFPNYFLITYNLLYQLFTSQDTNYYNTVSNTINDSNISKRSYATFKVNFSKLLKKNPSCILFPDICIMSYGYGDMKFGFLSDILIQNKYFASSGQITTIPQALNFPYLSGNYLVRGWGFVPSTNTINTSNIQKFFKEYLQAGVDNSMPLRGDDILSPYNNILNIQSSQIKLQTILSYLPQFSLIFNSTSLQNNFVTNTKFLNLLKEKNPANEFFSLGNWNW